MTDIEEGIGAKGLKTKLIINYLPQTMTEEEFYSIFNEIGKLESCKVMRDNASNYSFGYGFVDYSNPLDAETAISKINGYKILNKTLRVAFSKPPGSTKNVNLYVSGLSADTDKKKLEELFSTYGEVVQTRILTNADGSSKLVGFVIFKEKANADAAIRGLQGHTDGYGMNLQIKHAKDATDKKHPKFQEFIQHKLVQQGQSFYNNTGMGYQQVPFQQMRYQNPYGGGYGLGGDVRQKATRGRDVSARFNPTARPLGGGAVSGEEKDSSAAVLYCYNIGHNASKGDLYELFSQYGRITKVDIMEGKEFCFVHMPIPYEANEAVIALNGFSYNGNILQVSIKMKKT